MAGWPWVPSDGGERLSTAVAIFSEHAWISGLKGKDLVGQKDPAVLEEGAGAQGWSWDMPGWAKSRVVFRWGGGRSRVMEVIWRILGGEKPTALMEINQGVKLRGGQGGTGAQLPLPADRQEQRGSQEAQLQLPVCAAAKMADKTPRSRTTTPGMHRCHDGHKPHWCSTTAPSMPPNKHGGQQTRASKKPYNSQHASRERGNGGNSAPWRSEVAAALPNSRMRAAPRLWREEAQAGRGGGGRTLRG